jgi:capsular polysaccharide biosynthesis protein
MMMGLFIYLVKNKMMSNYFSYQNVVIVVLAQLLCGILYMFILSKLDATWIRDIEERIVRRCHN